MLRSGVFAVCLTSLVVVSLLNRESVPVVAQAPGLPLAVEPVASPAGANSSAPQLTVEGDRAILSWIERSGTTSAFKFAERTASGWSEARTVVSSDHLMVNSADVPSVRALPDGTLAAHWMEENGPIPRPTT